MKLEESSKKRNPVETMSDKRRPFYHADWQFVGTVRERNAQMLEHAVGADVIFRVHGGDGKCKSHVNFFLADNVNFVALYMYYMTVV